MQLLSIRSDKIAHVTSYANGAERGMQLEDHDEKLKQLLRQFGDDKP